MSITCRTKNEPERFQITHPFHPLHGREFDLVTRRFNWGEDRVYYHDGEGNLVSIPANYTNVDPTGPFVILAAGRSMYRYEDLHNLVRLIHQWEEKEDR